jgi:dTDP-4-dehydrorhamnose 3,5-epimerase
MQKIRDDRGWGLHNIFPLVADHWTAGQINLSETYPGVIRAYHRHHNQTDYWRVLKGSLEVRLYNPPDRGLSDMPVHSSIYLSDPSEMLEIPPLIWHGFRVLGNESAILLYYVTNEYNPRKPDEERMAWDTFGPWETEFK